MPKALKTYVVLADMHYPFISKPTFNAVLDFLDQNEVDGIVLQGDQFDFNCISHHTKNKPLYRIRQGYVRDIEGFQENVLAPLEALLKRGCEKYWIIGNHERFEQDLIEEQPELENLVNHVRLLNLENRGWQVIPLGHSIKLGKLNIVHGEVLSGIGNQGGAYPAKKAVELYAGNVLAAHSHAPQMFTKISPVEHIQKWQGYINGILGDVNPSYLRNRPSAWAHGFSIVELHPDGTFNLYQVNIHKGTFSYEGNYTVANKTRITKDAKRYMVLCNLIETLWCNRKATDYYNIDFEDLVPLTSPQARRVAAFIDSLYQ